MTARARRKNLAVLGAVSVALVAVPAVLIRFGIIDAYTAQILTVAGINAILALSVNIISGITGQLSLGQAGFMAIGAYSCIFLTQSVGLPLPVSVV
ncbi:MAG TPA: branched-chain amino acid ABC transporter permease, partial [Treponemataceae bacterium]|nr:branched-chain amino acid ABC transporter permease [Treponemataceae bacterium]